MLKDYSVLYVEDDKDMQRYMKTLLEDEVNELYQAFNGKEGLELFHDKKPDIIVSDINMPLMDGLTMATKIKEIDNTQLIIFFTTIDDATVLKKAIDINIDGYINKPLDDIEKFFTIIDSKVSKLKYEKMKHEKEKVESNMEIIYELLHHFRQPLSVILTTATTWNFKDMNNMEITSEDRENIDKIIASTQKLSQVLEEVEKIKIDDSSLNDILNTIQISNPLNNKLHKATV